VTVRVLVVEDEPLAARAHAEYTRRVDGFAVAGIAHTVAEAARHLAEPGLIDLILLDMNLPDGHGLGLLQRLRAADGFCDVMAVTSARDIDLVRRAVAQGVVLFLIKPFTFAMFRTKLEQYADYRRRLVAAPAQVLQGEVDGLLGSLRAVAARAAVPKGLSEERLVEVTGQLRASAAGLSARELAVVVGSSRVTARRYLEHLADLGLAGRALRYGGGRPEVEYRWVSPPR
jgi:response regulator of citrate/malate metabolism